MRAKGFFLTLALGLILTACSADQDLAAPEANHDSQIAIQAKNLLDRMTVEEKVGQIIQADISAVTPDDIKRYNLGSVLNGGNSAPGGGKTAEPEAWIALADAFWDASTDTSDGGVGIPLLWGTDAVHGHNNLQNATIFPHNSALGATHNPDLMRQIGDVTAREIRATGLDWTFAPTLAVARDDRWGRAYESYSENPELVAAYSSAIIEGLQGLPGDPDFLIGDNVMATAKHFLGDGGTQYGIDKGDTVGDLDQILKIHGAGYPPAFEIQVQSVMASFSSINGEKMHGSDVLLDTVLRDELGFEGFVVGDWNGHAEVPGCTATDCSKALDAGIDMFMAPDSWKGLYASLLRDAKNGTIKPERLDEAVLRILTAKIRSGLFEAGRPSERSTSDVSVLGRPDHLQIARQAVRESLVLLKNKDSILPINPAQTILVTGSGADSMQQQTGGWTLNWQGTGNANDEFETGQTIFAGLKEAVETQGGSISYSPDGAYDQKPDLAVIVFGEQPYAEYLGDRSDLVFEFDDGENLRLIKTLKDDGIPVISVFLTGRPLWVNPHLNASDAFVVAWLPGSEGAGVADVLVGNEAGDPRYPFTGRLSFSWPNDGTARPINSANDEGVLFAYGFGLNYDAPEMSDVILSEDPGVSDTSKDFRGVILERGQAAAAFQPYLGDSSNASLPVMSNAVESLGGGIRLSGIDYKAQEDARLLEWSGSGKAAFSLRAQRAIDLTELGAPEDLALSLTWRVGADAGEDLIVGLACGEGCEGLFNLTASSRRPAMGEWITTRIPLTCFIDNGLDATHVTSILSLSSDDEIDLALHSAAIETDRGNNNNNCN